MDYEKAHNSVNKESFNQDSDLSQIDREPSIAKAYYNQAKFWSDQAAFEQNVFTTHLSQIKSMTKDKSEREFGSYEDKYRKSCTNLNENLKNGHIDIETEAEITSSLITQNPNTSIEAQAGHFYKKRSQELLQAIESSDTDIEDKRDNINYVNGFGRAVLKHLDFRYMSPAEARQKYGAKVYDDLRTQSHNNVIKYLNRLNDLAEEYGVRPLTPRNFWPSDKVSQRYQTPEIAQRMKYDRDSVTAYYTNAFKEYIPNSL